MFFDRMRIITRLLIGFLLPALSIIILSIIATRSISTLAKMTNDIFEHHYAVSMSIMEVKNELLSNQIRIMKMARLDDPARIDLMVQEMEQAKLNIDKHLDIVREKFLGSKNDLDEAEKAITAWRVARQQTISLIRAGRLAEASIKSDGPDAALEAKARNEVDDIIAFATQKSSEFKKSAQNQSETSITGIYLAIIAITAGCIFISLVITQSVARSLKRAFATVNDLSTGAGEKLRITEAIAAGDLMRDIAVAEPIKIDESTLPNDEMGLLMKSLADLSRVQNSLDHAFQTMTLSLRESREMERGRDWLKTTHNELNAIMTGEHEPAVLSKRILVFLAERLRAEIGALYLHDDTDQLLSLVAGYALGNQEKQHVRHGEGIIGQAVSDNRMICLTDVPGGYMSISSATGEASPAMVVALPLSNSNGMVGALELGTFNRFSEVELEFLQQAGELITIGISISLARQDKNLLLKQTLEQTEELRVQQEELQQSNEELEERAEMLEQQREQIRLKNLTLESVSEQLRIKAEELERVSAYKSEFLANMSHELRTPLNSLMILSGLLKTNREGNLTPRQVEFASIINGSGADLLNLINDILDLSKIEAGKLEYHYEEIMLQEMCDTLSQTFHLTAEEKGLGFKITVDQAAPAAIFIDRQRTMQILKNLLSNAFKFTSTGDVSLSVRLSRPTDNPLSTQSIVFSVCDSGIGICQEKQQQIFQAFQQADGTTSRKYGGTGLGLSISLQLARAMGGDISVSSLEGEGSTFTLYLPLEKSSSIVVTAEPAVYTPPARVVLPAPPTQVEAAATVASPLPDDRYNLLPGSRSILVIEDDLSFAGILMEMLRERGYGVLVAADGESGVLLANHYHPSAIILDIMLPGMDGWRVMESLKDNPDTRHIPVHFLSCLEEKQKAMSLGAVGFISKPVDNEKLDAVFDAIEEALSRTAKKLLIIEDDEVEARSMVTLLKERDIAITVAATGREAIELLEREKFDSIVLDLGLSDMPGFELLEHMQKMNGSFRTPVIIHSGKDLTHEDERKLRKYAESIIIKGAKSPERLLNEVTLFLHLVENKLHPDKQKMIRASLDKESMLEGKKVLLVDDDMRNLFSLSSVLSERHMTVIEAENGKVALERLSEDPDQDIVLMDIMMPEMDGYSAIREIRKNPRFRNLPVIAMTAKALKGDHEKCLAAGASDYISKPIDVEKLMSLLRVWLYQHG